MTQSFTRLALALSALFSIYQTTAQSLQSAPTCGADAYLQRLLDHDPATRQRSDALESERYAVALQGEPQPKGSSGTYIVPVVFHIVHQNGVENIADYRIAEALQHLNEAFEHSGYYATAGAGTDMHIQFCLARRAPDGSATTGITRHASPFTDVRYATTDDDSLKNLVRWDPLQYINIWVVRSISDNVIGYATLPFSHGNTSDGLVLDADYVGASPAYDGLIAHEMGHYMGLYHTFQGGCPNDDCLLQGDRVCDTPPDQATFTACPFNSCHTDAAAPAPNPFFTDVNDPTENFMDYTPFACMYRYTPGQGERMRFFLSAVRTSLLNSTACIDACPVTVSTTIHPSKTTILVGDTILFTQQSQNAGQFEWYVDGFLAGLSPEFKAVGLSVGQHQIRLVARGGSPNCLATDDVVVTVACNLVGGILASATEVAPGGSITFTTDIATAQEWQWAVNGQAVGAGPSLTYTFNQLGQYTITLQVKNPWCERSVSQSVLVTPPCTNLAPKQLVYFPYGWAPLIRSLEAFPNGDLLLGGQSDYDPYIARFNAEGEPLWSRRVDNINFDALARAMPAPDGGELAYIQYSDSAYSYLLKLDAGGNQQWAQKIRNGFAKTLIDFALAPNGSCLVGGSPFYANGWIGHRLRYFDPEGHLQWTLGGPENNFYVGAIAALSGGDFSVAYSMAVGDFSIARVSSAGQIVWARHYNTGGTSASTYYLQPIVPEADGGFSFFYWKGNYEIVHVRCNDQGEVLSSKGFAVSTSNFNINRVSFARKTANGGYLLAANGGYGFIGGSTEIGVLLAINSQDQVLWAKGLRQFLGNSDQVDWAPYGMIPAGLDRNGGALAAVQEYDALYSVSSGRFRLMHTDGNGYAGGCIEQSVTVKVSTDSVSSTPFSFALDFVVDSLVTPIVLNVKDIPTAWQEACRQYPLCAENCQNNGIDDDRDGYPDCYDPQCNCFQKPACTVDSLPYNFRARIAWESADGLVNVAAVPMVANLNPQKDGLPEIVLPEGPEQNYTDQFCIFSGDGSNRLNPAKRSIVGLENFPAAHFAIADIDRDETPDVLMIPKFFREVTGFTAYDDTAATPMKNLTYYGGIYYGLSDWRPQLADFDNDGVPEFYFGNQISILGPKLNNRRYVRALIKADTTLPYGHLAFNNYQYKNANPVAAELLAANNCSGNPDCDGLELAAGPVIYAVDMVRWDNDPPQLVISRNLNDLDPTPAVWGDGYTAVADINLDNIPEVVVASRRDQEYGVYAWNRNGLVAFFRYPVNTPMSGGLPCIANVFDDRQAGFANDYPEIIAASGNRLTCFNLNAATAHPDVPWWWSIETADSAGFMGVTAFDFNADGLAEIVFRDPAELRIVYGGPAPFPPGVDPNRNWFHLPAAGPVGDSYPVVADCDGDGQAEIIFASYGSNGPDSMGSLDGRLRVLEADTLAWPGCRNFWNQYGYIGPQIDNDLTVPIHQLEPQRSFAGGKRPFNHYGQQIQDLDANFNPYIRAADLRVTVDSQWCGSAQLFAKITVCNSGSLQLPDSVPVRFYRGDPLNANAASWGIMQYLPGPILPGGCVQHTVAIPLENGQLYFGVVNDAGTTARPFPLGNGFHAGKGIECDYHNNLFPAIRSWTAPVLSLGPDQVLCTGNALPVDAGGGFSAYRWQDGSTDRYFTAPGPGVYWVDAFDICGLRQTDTLHILPDPGGVIDLGPDRLVCPGTAITLSVPGFDSVIWSPAGAVPCASCPVVTLTPSQTITLVVTGIDGDCYATDSIRIEVSLILNVNVSATPAQTGQNNGSAAVAPLGGAPPFSYLWNTGATTAAIGNLPPGQYTVTVTDAAGCTISTTVTVEQVVSTTAPDQVAALRVQPNPAGTLFRILLEPPPGGMDQARVINAIGQTMWTSGTATAETTWLVPCADWPPGIYQVIVQTADRWLHATVAVVR